jgi:hypothetical protein
MPPLTDEQIRRNVIREWILGFPRDTIATQNNIGAGTVPSIVANYKIGLEELDFNSVRLLAVEARKHGLNLYELASHFRLYNYFIKSGAAEEKIESFINMVHSTDISPEKLIELVNQLFNISKSESIPLDQVSGYIKEKLQEKQKIEEELREADALLQNKNMSIQAINEHIQLNEKLKEYNLSFQDIDKLLNVLVNAKEYGFDGKKIVAKLKKVQRLQNKEEKLKHHCEVLSQQVKECNNVLPLAQKILALNIDIKELLVFDTVVQEASKQYNLPPSVAAFRLFNEIRDYDKMGGLKKELNKLTTQVFAVKEICLRQNKSMLAMLNLQSRGIT